MRILITGAGRGGTNWTTEIVRASDKFNFTKKIEDRTFFKKWFLKKNYGTKLATENQGFNIITLNKCMQKYQDLNVVLVTRHPVDNCLSKIKRGQSKSSGGDSKTERVAPDGTPKGAIEAIRHMFTIFVFLEYQYPDRFVHVKMENLILKLDEEINKICEFLNIPQNERMFEAHKYNRNEYQKKRYGNEIDKSQIDMYKRWDTIYDGFFSDRKNDVIKLKGELKRISEYLGYKIEKI